MTRWIGLTLLQGTMTEARKRHTRTRSDRSGTDGRRWRAVCYQLSQMVLTMIFVVLLTSGGLNFLNGLTVSTQGTCTHLRISDNIVKWFNKMSIFVETILCRNGFTVTRLRLV